MIVLWCCSVVTDSPSLGQAAWSFGQIIIRSNDNAHGTLILSPGLVSVQENDTEVGVSVVRQGGVFGEVRIGFVYFLRNV